MLFPETIVLLGPATFVSPLLAFYLQALPVAIPLLSAEANQAAGCSSAEAESQLLSDGALQDINVAETTKSAAISLVSVPLHCSDNFMIAAHQVYYAA